METISIWGITISIWLIAGIVALLFVGYLIGGIIDTVTERGRAEQRHQEMMAAMQELTTAIYSLARK